HRGERFVVAVPGQMLDAPQFASFAQDLLRLHVLGVHLVIVHGTSAQLAARTGRPLRVVNGMHITTNEDMALAQDVAGSTRLRLEAMLSAGIPEIPGLRVRVVSGNYVTARPVGVRDGVDYQSTGEVRRIDGSRMRDELDQGALVVLSPIGFSPTGQSYDLDAGQLAVEVAANIEATKLLLLTQSGRVQYANGEDARELTLSQAEELQSSVDAEQQRLDLAINAAKLGVRRTHILDSRVDGVVPLELFTRDGVGTMVYVDPYDDTRRANHQDVPGMSALIRPLEERGILVPRTQDHLDADIEKFVVMERDGAIIACAAVFPSADPSFAELACLAVHPDYRAGERGDALLRWVEEDARAGGADQLFVLTTRTEDWFRERGFRPSSVDDLPSDRRLTYNPERNSRVLIKKLGGTGAAGAPSAESRR
nr:amino-acid N-acetyltransferase [Gammaproteobacteria bacterium]